MSAWWALAPAVVAWTVFCFVVAAQAHFRINRAMDKIEALRAPEIQRIGQRDDRDPELPDCSDRTGTL